MLVLLDLKMPFISALAVLSREPPNLRALLQAVSRQAIVTICANRTITPAAMCI
jgi:hypothetical protein